MMMRSGIRSGVLALAVCVASVVDARSTPPQLEIQLQAVKTNLLAGEPLIVLITLKGEVSLDLEADLTFPTAPLQLLIDRGRGFAPYIERAFVATDRYPDKRPLAGGEERLEYALSADERTDDWIFPTPGTYRLVVEYHDDTLGPVRSNELTVSVRAPSGDEKTVHDALRALGPHLLGNQGGGWADRLSSLIDTHPASVYLQESRILDLRFRQQNILSGYDPTYDELPQEDPPLRPNFLPGVQKAWFETLLPTAEALATTAGQFEPDALLELGGVYRAVGQEDLARRAWRDVVERFPLRKAATLARAALGDITPPQLAVTATPAVLWPPNHRLVRIAVTVNVNDDLDSNPAVKLVSITCDDGCNPGQDVAGATLSTDDREFDLRAERTGAGSGRTYTITYSATDDSGNSATGRATVRVPHDHHD